jgi:hypothetical protein
MTGMFLQLSSSMIEVSSEKPDIDGNSTSVNTRSIPDDLFFNVSHAFKASRTAATAFKKKIPLRSSQACWA